MPILMKVDGVRPDPARNDLPDGGIGIEYFAFSHEVRDTDDEAETGPFRIQVTRRGDGCSADLLRLALSRSVVPEITLLFAAEHDSEFWADPTRIIFLDATIEVFVTVGNPTASGLEESLTISAKRIIYEHGSRRLDERRIGQ